MAEYKALDEIGNLNTDQLDLMVRSDHGPLIDYLEKNTIFDVHRIRLLLELGQERANEMLESYGVHDAQKTTD